MLTGRLQEKGDADKRQQSVELIHGAHWFSTSPSRVGRAARPAPGNRDSASHHPNPLRREPRSVHPVDEKAPGTKKTTRTTRGSAFGPRPLTSVDVNAPQQCHLTSSPPPIRMNCSAPGALSLWVNRRRCRDGNLFPGGSPKRSRSRVSCSSPMKL